MENSKGEDMVKSSLAYNVSDSELKSQWLNIKYPPTPLVGAKGDGITDDTEAINKALIYARANRKKLYFPCGIYCISETILLNSRYDYIVGESMYRTLFQPTKADLTCFDLSVLNTTLENIGFSCQATGPAYLTYKALELHGCHNTLLNSIYCVYANKFINITGNVYELSTKNMSAWKVNYGLYCNDGTILNNSYINFTLLYGSKQTDLGYKTGTDIGIRLTGSNNKIIGGEHGYFYIAWEIAAGANNMIENIWAESNLYDLKNTGLLSNIIINAHCVCIHPVGSKNLCTENGYGSPGVMKDLGPYGFDLYDHLKYYCIFDEPIAPNTFYDYSFNNVIPTVTTDIIVQNRYNSYGTTKDITILKKGNCYNFGSFIDTTKPFSFCFNGFPLTNRLNGLSIIHIKSGSNVIEFISDSSGITLSIFLNYKFIGNASPYGTSGDGYLYIITIDFPNNKLITFIKALSEPTDMPIDLTGFVGMSTLKFLNNGNPIGNATPDVTVIANYLMMWDRSLDMYDFFNIAKIKSHVMPLAAIRKIQDNEAKNARTSIIKNKTFQTLADRIESMEFDIIKPAYSELLLQNDSIFTLGTGKNAVDAYIDVSDSVVDGNLTFEIEGQTLINAITNGDFSNGIVGWEPLGATLSAKDGILTVTKNSAYLYPYSAFQSVSANITNTLNRVIAMKCKFRVTNSACSKVIFYMVGSTSGQQSTLVITNPVQDTWYEKTIIFTLGAEIIGSTVKAKILTNYADITTSNGKTMEVQQVMAIDLTTLFDAGNEPTQNWCDNNLKYFNGTKSVGENVGGVGVHKIEVLCKKLDNSLSNKVDLMLSAPLRKITSGVMDKYSGGKISRYITVITNQLNNTKIAFSNMKTGGVYIAFNSNGEYKKGIKGEILSFIYSDVTIYYELEMPLIETINFIGLNSMFALECYEKGYIVIYSGVATPRFKYTVPMNLRSLIEANSANLKFIKDYLVKLDSDTTAPLLNFIDKELRMKNLSLLTTETTLDLKAKINEIINIWK